MCFTGVNLTGEIQKKGVLLLADDLEANARAGDFRYADMLLLGRRDCSAD